MLFLVDKSDVEDIERLGVVSLISIRFIGNRIITSTPSINCSLSKGD